MYFPTSLTYNVLQFSANVLLHLRTEPELKERLGKTGIALTPLLSQFRTVEPTKLEAYYEHLSGVCSHLMKFSALCESCSKSGAYRAKREAQFEICKQAIEHLESQPDLIRLMRDMHKK